MYRHSQALFLQCPRRHSLVRFSRSGKCVDHWALNSLLPLVVKVSAKVQGILYLVPLIKIGVLYAMSQGPKGFHFWAAYQVIILDSQVNPPPKLAFITSIGKIEFKKVLFILAQAPIHFQQFTNEVLNGLEFVCGYLDDILIFSSTAEEHLKYLRILFEWHWFKIEEKEIIC